MITYLKSYAAVAAVSAMLIAAGCQTTTQPHSSALVRNEKGALTCRDCKVSTVQNAGTDPNGYPSGSSSRKEMVCPDCKNYDDSWEGNVSFMRHVCTTCGQSIGVCSMHPSH